MTSALNFNYPAKLRADDSCGESAMLARPWGNSPTSLPSAMFVASENIALLPDELSVSENNEQSRAGYHVILFSLFGIRRLDKQDSNGAPMMKMTMALTTAGRNGGVAFIKTKPSGRRFLDRTSRSGRRLLDCTGRSCRRPVLSRDDMPTDRTTRKQTSGRPSAAELCRVLPK